MALSKIYSTTIYTKNLYTKEYMVITNQLNIVDVTLSQYFEPAGSSLESSLPSGQVKLAG